jgi:murein L,D-transpeptidase YcbB/YkuD
LRRDPLYLQKNDIVILNRDADPNGLNVDWRKVSAARFPFQLRQRPGSKNPLGLIKFEMANGFDVYLHDTPAKGLFARARRGLSHGCIRVEQPATLALRLLPDWHEADLQAAIASGETRLIPLPRPLPVYLLYWTAFVDDSGQLNFRDDLYGRDGAIAVALGLSVPAPPKVQILPVATADCIAPS